MKRTKEQEKQATEREQIRCQLEGLFGEAWNLGFRSIKVGNLVIRLDKVFENNERASS